MSTPAHKPSSLVLTSPKRSVKGVMEIQLKEKLCKQFMKEAFGVDFVEGLPSTPKLGATSKLQTKEDYDKRIYPRYPSSYDVNCNTPVQPSTPVYTVPQTSNGGMHITCPSMGVIKNFGAYSEAQTGGKFLYDWSMLDPLYGRINNPNCAIPSLMIDDPTPLLSLPVASSWLL